MDEPVLILLSSPIKGDSFLVSLMELMDSRGESLFETLEVELKCEKCKAIEVEHCEHNDK